MQSRRFKIIIFTLVLLTLLSSISYGASSFLNIKIDGRKMQVREVPILMNGKILKSDSPSFLYVDRTLVSARLISENYGAKVAWDHPTSTAIINHNGNKIELKINSSLAKVNGKPIELDKYSTPKLVDFGSGDAKTMVPLTFLAEVLGYETDWNETEKAAYLKKKTNEEVEKPGEKDEVPDREVEKPEEKPIVGKNSIKGLEATSRNNKDAIIIRGTSQVKRSVLNLNNPKRLVIDFMDSELIGTDYLEKTFNIEGIKKVRVSQFSPDKNYKPNDRIVRAVVDLEEYINQADIQLVNEAGNIVLIPKVNVKNNLTYNREANIIKLKANKFTNFDINYDKNDFILSISGPSSDLDLPMGKLEILSPILIDYEITDLGSRTEVKAHFTRDINYNILKGPNSNELEIKISKNGVIEKSDRLIVLDPGHGGADPGTSSASGIREKDVALKISLKLRDKLLNAGYGQVLMTRNTDKTLVLRDRPKFANENYADVFVSIHANSAGNKSVKGIEVLYAPNSNNYAKGAQQTKLAQLVQDELIKATGTSNRGIKKRTDLVVTRETNMSAILVETGFLSNASEANSLNSDSYQELVAEAIFKGLESYFSIYN